LARQQISGRVIHFPKKSKISFIQKILTSIPGGMEQRSELNFHQIQIPSE